MMPRRSQEEINSICEKAHERITAGEMASDVCKELGCVGVYYKWRRKSSLPGIRKLRRAKALVPLTPVHHVFPITEPVAAPRNENDYLSIKGSPETIARFIKEMRNG